MKVTKKSLLLCVTVCVCVVVYYYVLLSCREYDAHKLILLNAKKDLILDIAV